MRIVQKWVRWGLGVGQVLWAGLALAHAHLEQAQPAPESKSEEVRLIRLVFSEAVESKLSSIRLEDREDRALVEPSAQVEPTNPRALTVKLFDKLAPGAYTLRWSVVSADGHRVSGSYRFWVSN